MIKHHPFVNMLIDPFTSETSGIPDTFNRPTVPFKTVNTYNVSASSGYFVKAETPSIVSSHAYCTLSNGVVNKPVYSDYPDTDAIMSNFVLGRLLVLGIELDCLQADINSKGNIGVCALSSVNEIVGQHASSMLKIADYSGPIKHGLHGTLRPSQMPRLSELSSAGLNLEDFGVLCIFGEGLDDSSPCVSVKVTRHYELIPMFSGIYRNASRIVNGDMFALQIASNMSTVGVHASSNSQDSKRKLKRAARLLADIASKALVSAFPQVRGIVEAGKDFNGILSNLRLTNA